MPGNCSDVLCSLIIGSAIFAGKKLDKDVFREDLGNLRDAYTEVADRLGVMPKISVGSKKPTLVK